MANGVQFNTSFRVLVDELARAGLVQFLPEKDMVAITPEGRRELRAGN
jgi:hypothetical protein